MHAARDRQGSGRRTALGSTGRLCTEWCLVARHLLFKMLPETFTQPIKSKRIDAGIAEGQGAGKNSCYQMKGGSIDRRVVRERAVQVEDVVGQPAEGKQSHKHQHCLCNSLAGFNLQEINA